MAYLETPTVSIGGGHRLRADAARQWKLMDSAFRKARGHDIPITSSTRTMARQDYLYQGWIKRLPGFNLALPAGQSTHNFGTAIDAGGNAGIEGTADHNWLVKNGPKYGWHWTGRNFSHRESWHFDYKAGTATITATNASPSQTATAEEEDEDMAVNSGFYYKNGSKQMNVVVNFGSGAFHEYEASGDYNNGIAGALQTADYAKITKSHRDRLEDDMRLIRQGK